MSRLPVLTIPNGYCAQAPDTHLEADALEFYLLRQRSVSDRLQMAAHSIRNARRLSLQTLQQRFAQLSSKQFARKVAETWCQEDCPQNYIPTGSDMAWIQDSIELATHLHQIFEAISVDYYITGAVAMIQRLFDAIQESDIATVKTFIESGACLDTYDELGRSPLTLAAGLGNLDIVRSPAKIPQWSIV